MINAAGIVDHALRAAGIPIIGVSIGTLSDRSTWAVQFDPAATVTQQAQAIKILTTVTIDEATQAALTRVDAQAQIDVIPLYVKAMMLAMVDQLNLVRTALPVPLPALTPSQAMAAIKQKASGL